MLGSKIKPCKPPKNDLKVVSVIEMTLLYDARYSFFLLKPKNEVKLLTQSAANSICMGKWRVPSLAEFIHHVLVVPYVPEFFSDADGSLVLGKLTPVHNRSGDGGKKK